MKPAFMIRVERNDRGWRYAPDVILSSKEDAMRVIRNRVAQKLLFARKQGHKLAYLAKFHDSVMFGIKDGDYDTGSFDGIERFDVRVYETRIYDLHEKSDYGIF